jgi:PAS domain S-box-containing protein
MITNEINILHLEDEVMDAYLVRKILERAMLKFTITVICDKASFLSAIQTGRYDIILADHSMPQFTAVDALRIMKEKNIEIPFILVTGTVSEEYSVNAMKEGAWDYILKDRLQRLPSAVTGTLERYQATVDKRKHLDEIIAREGMMKEAEKMAGFGSWQADMVSGTSFWSDHKYRILGYEPGDVVPSFESFMARIHPEDREYVIRAHEDAFAANTNLKYECRVVTPTGAIRYLHSELVIKRDEQQQVTALAGFIHDVTEARSAMKQKEDSEKKYKYLFEHSPQPAWVTDSMTHKFLDVNHAAISFYGYSYDEFLSMTALDILPDSDKEDYLKHTENSINNNCPNWKQTRAHLKKDGIRVMAEITSSSVIFDGKPAQLILITSLRSSSGL